MREALCFVLFQLHRRENKLCRIYVASKNMIKITLYEYSSMAWQRAGARKVLTAFAKRNVFQRIAF